MPMYTIPNVEVDPLLKDKYQVHSYQQLEIMLLQQLNSPQMVDNSYAKCGILLDLANVYFHFNKRLQALQILEEADSLIIEYGYLEFVSAVYLLRAHMALLHKDWSTIHELCNLGITNASKYKKNDVIACCYLILMQMALNDELYERAILLGKLVIHFAKKHKGGLANFMYSVSLFLLQSYVALQKNDEARQLIRMLTAKKNLTAVSEAYVKLAETFYTWLTTSNVEDEEQLHEKLEQLWRLNQYAEVLTMMNCMFKYTPMLYATYAQYKLYEQAFQLDESMLRILEKLDSYDQIRAVQITNGNDEKIGYHTGQSYRKLLQQQITAANEEQFITIITFVIWVNERDILNRHLKVKYDYYIKIDQDFSRMYPESTRGKYYPSSFCAMFITDEQLNIQNIAEKCQSYLDKIQLELDGQRIYYHIHMGAASVQKKTLKSLQHLYQDADQSLYYAKVMKQRLVISGEGR